MGPRSFQIRISGPKIWSAPTKTDLPYNFCFINCFPSLTVAAVDALQTLFRAPPDPGGPPRGPKHSLWPGPCKVRPPCQIWWGLVQRCGFLYRTHEHTHTHRFNFIYKITSGNDELKTKLINTGPNEQIVEVPTTFSVKSNKLPRLKKCGINPILIEVKSTENESVSSGEKFLILAASIKKIYSCNSHV